MKVNGKKVKGSYFAYDGCHKIYILENKKAIASAEDYGYRILPIKYLEEYYNASCGLRFIEGWSLHKEDTDEYITYVAQFENATFEY